MKDVQPSFTEVEHGMRRRSTRRETFLTMMDEVIPWAEWIGLIEPHYYRASRWRNTRLSMSAFPRAKNLAADGPSRKDHEARPQEPDRIGREDDRRPFCRYPRDREGRLPRDLQ